MKFIETRIPGFFIVEIEPINDQRGFFARSYTADAFKEAGVDSPIVQCNISFSKKRGTLRGMHYQIEPFEEIKMVRAVRGKVFDAVIDLRRESKTFKKWEAVELSGDNRKMLVIPPGCAHGFQTLENDCELHYGMTQVYSPEHARGARWDDPEFGVAWPLPDPILSDRDRSFPLFADRKDMAQPRGGPA